MAKSVAERLNAVGISASRGTITLLDPEALTVVTDKKHVLYDPRVDLPLEEAMLQSLDEQGVLQPIRVRENGEKDGRPLLEVIFGRRRTRHLCEVNRRRAERGLPPHKMPVTFVHGSDQEMLLLMLAENFQRKDDTPASAAWKVQTAIKLGSTPKEVAGAIGCSEARVNNLLDFLNLHKEVQDAIEAGSLPIGAVQSFASLPREEQPAALQTALAEGATKNHEIREVVEAKKSGKSYKPATRKRAWGRREFSIFLEHLAESSTAEARRTAALVQFFLGKEHDEEALSPYLREGLAAVQKKLGRTIRTKKVKK